MGRDLINLITTREGVDELLSNDDVIDLVIPRGSNSLVRCHHTLNQACRIPRSAAVVGSAVQTGVRSSVQACSGARLASNLGTV